MDQLDTFISSIIDAKQLPGITEEAKIDLIAEMKERLLDLIDRALIEALPEDKVDALTALAENEATTDEELQQFVVNSGVNVEEVTAQTLAQFKDLYLAPAQDTTEA